MTTLNSLTIEHLGEDATEQDLLQFGEWVLGLMDRDGLSEQDAIAAVWGDGDYISAATRLGLNS